MDNATTFQIDADFELNNIGGIRQSIILIASSKQHLAENSSLILSNAMKSNSKVIKLIFKIKK